MRHNIISTYVILMLLFWLWSPDSSAQGYGTGTQATLEKFPWPDGKKMALSLTFDDARLSQADIGIPLLDKHGVRATFYVSPGNFVQRVDTWKKAVASGHDIGNHSILHPCTGNFAWSRHKALEDYTLEKMRSELDSASRMIEALVGVRPASFAFPCGQKFVGRGTETKSYVPLIAEMFETGRGWLDEGPNNPAFCDLAQLTGMELDGKSFREILNLIESAREQGYWLILAGHEMNKDGFQTSRISVIDSLCRYAADPGSGIWIDNVNNVAAYVKAVREGPVYYKDCDCK